MHDRFQYVISTAVALVIALSAYAQADLRVGVVLENSAVVLRYSKEVTSLRDPASIRADAGRLQGKVDHPDFAEWSRHARLLESPDRSSARLVYGGPRAIYHLTNMARGVSWERGATSRKRWSFFNQGGSGEPAGDLIVVEVGKPVPVHRDASKMLEESERDISLFAWAGLPRSATFLGEGSSSRVAFYESKPLGRRYAVSFAESGSNVASTVEVSPISDPSNPVERIIFSSDVVRIGDGLVLPRSAAVESVHQSILTTYRLDRAELIGKSEALALAEVPVAAQFGPTNKVRTIDFSERSTIDSEEYAGVPTVTWTIRDDGKDEFAYKGLPITPTSVSDGPPEAAGDGDAKSDEGFVVSRIAVAGIAAAVGILVFGVFVVNKKGSTS
jgi:hypothetical protein